MYKAVVQVKEDLEYQLDLLKKDNENLRQMYYFNVICPSLKSSNVNDVIQMTSSLALKSEKQPVGNFKMAKIDSLEAICKNGTGLLQEISPYQLSQPYTAPNGKLSVSETLQMEVKPESDAPYPSQYQPWTCAHCTYINDDNCEACFSCGQRKAKEKWAWICSACDAHNMWCNRRCWKCNGLGSGTNVFKAVGAMTVLVPVTFAKIIVDVLAL